MADRLPRLRARAAMTAAARDFFGGQGFTEVETPALQVSPGMEPWLVAFETRLREPFAPGEGRAMYLHTSPEFAMKKLLAAGIERPFQLARTYRNAERSPTHHPEFTMLEWYRAGEGWRATAADCEGLLRQTLAAAPAALRGGMGGFTWGGAVCDPALPWEYLSVAEAFAQHAGVDVLATAPAPQTPDAAALAAEAQRIGVHVGAADAWEDVFFRIFLERIEPHLGQGAPTVLYDWPISMAALARPHRTDPRLCERFELYVCGMELANGFGELTDADEQRRRFEADMEEKARLYGERYPIDEDFLAALPLMPEASGSALGFDRLVMLLLGAPRIEDIQWTPAAEPA
jgi:lysyl-tRNA synthetase class 2